MVRWLPWRSRDKTERRSLISISDPRMLRLFGAPLSASGIDIGEGTALTLSAVWRAVNLVSGTLGSLPLPTYELAPEGRRQVPSWLDAPDGPDGQTAMEWKETIFAYLNIHGNAFLLHQHGAAGQIIGAVPVHPLAVGVDVRPYWPDGRPAIGGKVFEVTLPEHLPNGALTIQLDGRGMTHIPGLCLDGERGLSPITVARNSLGNAVGGERAAARMYRDGALIGGMVTPDGDDYGDDEDQVQAYLDRTLGGWENASSFRYIPRQLKFQKWAFSAEDAQFLQSRQFSVEEIARWWGIPPYELMQTEKQTSWGTGIEAQQRGLARQVLRPWAVRVEQRLNRLLGPRRFTEHDFTSLIRPSPEIEIPLIIQQVQAGLMTINEARGRLGLPPVAGGDVLMGGTGGSAQ